MQTKFGLASFIAVITVIIVAILLFIPIKYYQSGSDTWTVGPSTISRMISGGIEGIPFEQVAWQWVQSGITNPLENKCSTSADCVISHVESQCSVYCGNNAADNEVSLKQLSMQRSCDPSRWKIPKSNCGCIFGKCTLFTQ